MDLRAFCELDYDAALGVVEKVAAEKAANGLTDALARAGTGVRDFADRHLGAAARGAAADGVKAWWEQAKNDPARLALLGAGVGAGAGGLGSLAFGRPGRRRPLQGMLLGGLLGAAGAGGIGYGRQLLQDAGKRQADLNKAKGNLAGAQEQLSIEEEAGTPLGVPGAVGRGVERAVGQFANNDPAGAVKTLGNTARHADVVGVGEIFDRSGRNDDIAPSSFVNAASGRAVGMLPDSLAGNPAEREALRDYLRLPNVNPAAESVGGLAAADYALASRAESLYNPRFLREAISTTDKLPSHLSPQDLSAIRRAVTDAPDTNRLRWFRGGRQDLRTALGGRLESRLPRLFGLGGIGDGLVVRPGAPAAPASTAGLPLGAPLPPPTPAVPPLTVSRGTLESIAREGQKKVLEEAGQARGFLRSGFGSSAGGRLGGIGLPRWMVYPAVPTAVHWTRSREQGLAAARQQVEAARHGVADAQSKLPQPAGPR